jgi:ATP-dependent Lon protease
MPEKKRIKQHILPLLPLRGLTVFPYMILTFDVGRDKSIKALDEAMIHNQLIFLTAQKDAKNDAPEEDDIYRVGTISRVKQLLKLPGDTIRVLVEGISRAEVKNFVQTEPYFIAEVIEKTLSAEENGEVENEALKRKILSTFDEYARLNGKISPDTLSALTGIEDISQLSDIIASNLMLRVEQKQDMLGEFHPARRIEKLLAILLKEIEILEVEKNISVRVRKFQERLMNTERSWKPQIFLKRLKKRSSRNWTAC